MWSCGSLITLWWQVVVKAMNSAPIEIKADTHWWWNPQVSPGCCCLNSPRFSLYFGILLYIPLIKLHFLSLWRHALPHGSFPGILLQYIRNWIQRLFLTSTHTCRLLEKSPLQQQECYLFTDRLMSRAQRPLNCFWTHQQLKYQEPTWWYFLKLCIQSLLLHQLPHSGDAAMPELSRS